jgi:hypothetical protein
LGASKCSRHASTFIKSLWPPRTSSSRKTRQSILQKVWISKIWRLADPSAQCHPPWPKEMPIKKVVAYREPLDIQYMKSMLSFVNLGRLSSFFSC